MDPEKTIPENTPLETQTTEEKKLFQVPESSSEQVSSTPSINM